MKINKNLFQIISSFMIGAGLVFSYFYFSSKPIFSAIAARSIRIPLDTAEKYYKKFDKIKPLRVTHKGKDNTQPERTEPLEGFVFNASDLYEIVRENRSGETPDEVIFYFGQDGEAGDAANKHGVIHIIAIGRLKDTLLIKDVKTGKNQPSIFDRADPCPPFCGTIKEK